MENIVYESQRKSDSKEYVCFLGLFHVSFYLEQFHRCYYKTLSLGIVRWIRPISLAGPC